jgi:hypothetical protein
MTGQAFCSKQNWAPTSVGLFRSAQICAHSRVSLDQEHRMLASARLAPNRFLHASTPQSRRLGSCSASVAELPEASSFKVSYRGAKPALTRHVSFLANLFDEGPGK